MIFLYKKISLNETITISLTEYNALKKRVAELEEQIRLLKNGYHSNTGSTPPSHDIGRSNRKSLRKRSFRKKGGQLGHEGSTLEMTENPYKIIEYRPCYCKQCGEKLNVNEAIMVAHKQEIVLPPIVPQYIEHRAYSCKCPKCGFVTTSDELPKHLKANVQYGTEVSALLAYLSVRHYLPYNRIAELMSDCFHLHISAGTIDNMLQNLTEKAQPIYEQIRQRIEQSPVIGGDETGIKINSKKAWLFTFQTQELNFLTVSLSRGYEMINNLFKNGFPVSVYVTDCLPAQLKVHAKLHQICTAHLLRELNNFIDVFKYEWSMKMKQLLQDAIELKSQLKPADYLSPNEKVMLIQNRMVQLLQTNLSDKHKKVQTFIKRLSKNHDAILTFLYYPKVPPDNNGSERAIRNAKVKMKVSNQFKTLVGANRFAVLRSVIDTTIKNSHINRK